MILVIILMCQGSSARLLCGSNSVVQENETDVGPSVSAGIALQMEQKKMEREGVLVITVGGRNYKSLLLNVLPKGSRAPSGPSKRTNNLVN
ncbi:hypothetical protein LINGRAHAP2_LOCUS4639 [Linum grandiflorum]